MAERNPIVYVNGYPQEIADTDRVKNTGIAYQAGQPSNPQNGDAWLDSGVGILKVYASGAWQQPSYFTSVELSNDSTPQLGGPLDVNGQIITSAGNTNVRIDPAGTGAIEIGAAITSSNADIVLDPHGTGNIVSERLSKQLRTEILTWIRMAPVMS